MLLRLLCVVVAGALLLSSSLAGSGSGESGPPLIILVALPLSGHHVLHEAFLALGIKSAHNEVNKLSSKLCTTFPIPSVRVGGTQTPSTVWPQISGTLPGCYVGQIIHLSIAKNKAPLRPLIDQGYTAFTQLDICRSDACIFPQMEALEEIVKAYPNAYYIHTHRSSIDEHAKALLTWQREGESLLERYEKAGYLSRYSGQSPKKSLLANAQLMLSHQTKVITGFFANASSSVSTNKKAASSRGYKFLDVNVLGPDAAQRVKEFLGLAEDLVFVVPPEFFVNSSSSGGSGESVRPAATAGETTSTSNKKSAHSSKSISAPSSFDATDKKQVVDNNDDPKNDSSQKPDDIVILVGLPKSGTTSIQEGLRALGVSAAHYEVNKYRDSEFCTHWPISEVSVGGKQCPVTKWKRVYKADGCYVGEVMQRAMVDSKAPLDTLIGLGYKAFTQMDVCRGDGCIFPQVEALDEITQAYPNAYYIHTRRSSTEVHASSMAAWDGMLERFEKGGYFSKFNGQSKTKSLLDNGRIMIESMQTTTLSFFKKNPDLKFIDINIEDSTSQDRLRAFLNCPGLVLEKRNSGHYNQKHPPATTTPTAAP